MDPQVKYIGMAWYRRKDYKKLLKLFVDSSKLPKTYDKWLKLAQKGFDDLVIQGCIVEEVYIDPETFPTWCVAHGLDIDAKARVRFANEFVARKHLGNDK